MEAVRGEEAAWTRPSSDLILNTAGGEDGIASDLAPQEGYNDARILLTQ